MRKKLTDTNNQKPAYEIREIVNAAAQIEATGKQITWENIGDPIAKGESIPGWLKDIVARASREDQAYAYSPTKGLAQTRQFIAQEHDKQNLSSELTPENILFFNGLGDAISSIYRHVSQEIRIIGPDPAYPSHAAGEVANSHGGLLTYQLNPGDGWQVDTDDLKTKLEANEDIAGILLINPGNPTGAVFTKETLREVVRLADEYDCFIIADVIYEKLRFADAPEARLTDVLGDVPAILMRGLSKEVPWPGSRCGWLEFYNLQDPEFADLKKQLEEAKMQEVCSTTLPQLVLPKIFSDERLDDHIDKRVKRYQDRAEVAAEELNQVSGISAIKPEGAFYMSVVFDQGVLSDSQSLPIDEPRIAEIINPHLKGASPDKRFVYYLLAAEGVCVVPLSSGFHSCYHGFRITLLEPDAEKFTETINKIKRAVRSYLES